MYQHYFYEGNKEKSLGTCFFDRALKEYTVYD